MGEWETTDEGFAPATTFDEAAASGQLRVHRSDDWWKQRFEELAQAVDVLCAAGSSADLRLWHRCSELAHPNKTAASRPNPESVSSPKPQEPA